MLGLRQLNKIAGSKHNPCYWWFLHLYPHTFHIICYFYRSCFLSSSCHRINDTILSAIGRSWTISLSNGVYQNGPSKSMDQVWRLDFNFFILIIGFMRWSSLWYFTAGGSSRAISVCSLYRDEQARQLLLSCQFFWYRQHTAEVLSFWWPSNTFFWGIQTLLAKKAVQLFRFCIGNISWMLSQVHLIKTGIDSSSKMPTWSIL